MKLADLSAEIIEKIKTLRFDRIIEKHEGPWDWKAWIEDTEIVSLGGRFLILPVDKENIPNLSEVRTIPSSDGHTLTVFLKDTTYVSDPKWEWLEAGRLAICEKIAGTDVFIATVYHEWMIVQNERLRG